MGVGFSQRFFSIICKTFLTIFQFLFFQAHPSSTGSRPHRRLCEPRQCVILSLTAQFLFLVWPVSQSNISFHVADNNLLCSEFTCSAEFKQLPKSRQNTPAFVCYHKLTLEFNWPPRVLLFAFSVYNFSHRIDHLSFGEEVPGIISPLDGTEKITFNSESRLFSHVRAEGRAPRRGIDSDNIISTEFDPFNFSFLLQITRCSSTSSQSSPPNSTPTRYLQTRTSSPWLSGWDEPTCFFFPRTRPPTTHLLPVPLSLSGAGDKPRSGKPWRLGDLRQVRHQLADGDSQRAAHAAVAVPGAAVRHRRRDLLHHGWVRARLGAGLGQVGPGHMVLTGAALLFLSAAGMLHGLVGCFFDVVCCRFKLGACRPREVRHTHTSNKHTGFHCTPLGSDWICQISSRKCHNIWTIWTITRLHRWQRRQLRSRRWTFWRCHPVLFLRFWFYWKVLLSICCETVLLLFFLGYHYKVVILWNTLGASLLSHLLLRSKSCLFQ